MKRATRNNARALNTKKRRRELEQACDLFVKFRESAPKKAKVVKVNVPSALMVVGHCEYIGYRTTHGRDLTLYEHEFVEGSRPLLCSSPDGKQLFLLGGRFEFGERGIVDVDRKGREVDHSNHGKTLKKRRS